MMQRPGYVAVVSVVVGLAVFMAAVFGMGEFGTAISMEQTGSRDAVAKEEAVTFTVNSGESFRSAVTRLYNDGLLRHPLFFALYAVLRGDTHRVKAGTYQVDREQSPRELLDHLVTGDTLLTVFTVPEGFNLHDVARRVEAMGLGSAEQFVGLAMDQDFIATLDLPVPEGVSTLEGLLFPETYYVHKGVGAASLIRSMVRQFMRRAWPPLEAQAADVGMSPYEVLTLASVVEKETGVPEERSLIAGVFHNRLRTGMRLDSDPTVIYGVDGFDGNLTRAHLRTPTAYNTYQVHGLPPTPIANPGLDAILATLNPADVPYLFFVAKGDGTHHFSESLRAHNRAVYKYQKKPHRRGKS